MNETKLSILVHRLFNSPQYHDFCLIPLLSWATVVEAEPSQDRYACIQTREEAPDRYRDPQLFRLP